MNSFCITFLQVWKEHFFNQVAGPSIKAQLVDSEEEKEKEEDNEICQLKLAISNENAAVFLDFRGFTALASNASQFANTMASLYFKAMQSSLDDSFMH